MTREEELFTQPTGSIAGYHMVNPGDVLPAWRARHNGTFRDDNPYYIQLQTATEKQDIDALYERAVEWEADYANRQMQLRENREILEEQRAYDSPEERIARERAAGINSDIAGSSSGQGSAGSSAQLTNPGMADQQGQNKFGNYYDNANVVLQGINTAVSAVSAFTGAYSTIVGALDTLATQNSRIALNDAQAQLGKAQANEIDTLLNGRKEAIGLANTGQKIHNAGAAIQNSNAILQHLAGYSRLISADSTDDSIIAGIKSLGLSDDEATLGSYKDIVKQFHANPEMQAKYYNDTLEARTAEQREEQFDVNTVAEIVTFQKRQARADAAWNANVSELQSKVARMLNTNDYATDLADLEYSQVLNANMGADIIGQQLEADLEGMAAKVNEYAAAADACQKEYDEIKANPAGVRGTYTEPQKSRMRQLQYFKSVYLSSGSEKYEECFDIINEMNRQTTTYESWVKGGWPDMPTANLGGFNQETFVGIYDKRRKPGEVITEVGKTAITALAIYATGKGVSSNIAPPGKVDLVPKTGAGYTMKPSF